MSPFHVVLSAIAAYGPSVLLGVTVVLLCGVVAMVLHRAPAQRRRLGLTTALGVSLYLLVGLLPLPRIVLRVAEDDAVAAASPVLVPDAETRAARLQAALAALTAPLTDVAVASPPNGASQPSSRLATTMVPGLLARAAAWPWHLVLAAAYAFGVVVQLLRTLVGHLQLRRLLAGCEPVPVAMRCGLELPRRTRVLSTPRAVRPFCAGVWRPVVVLPRSLLAPGCADEAHAVLRHEAAHVVAGDARVRLLLAWLAVPLFCHPLFWWLCREVRFCSELLADDAAARAGGRQRYARALIDLAERADLPVAAAGTVAVFHRPSEFYRRIQMLLQRQGPLSTSTTRGRRAVQSISMLCLVGAAASLFGVPAPAQEPASSLRQQNAELRSTIELLRSELAELRGQIHALRDAQSEGVGGMAPHALQNAEDQRVREMLNAYGFGARDERTSLQHQEEDPVTASGKRLDADRMAAVQRYLMDRQPVASGNLPLAMDPLGAAPTPPPQDPVGQPPLAPAAGGVPVLSDLPLLGNLFRQHAEAVAARLYEVKKGDSLQRIARSELGSAARADEIAALNPGLQPEKLRPGQRLLLPAVADVPPEAVAMPVETPVANLQPAPGAPVTDVFGAPGMATPMPSPLPPATPSSVSALADLTSRYLDLQGELEVQRPAAAEMKALAETGQVSQSEARRAAVTLRTLERKLAIATRLIDGEIAATESELQWLERRRAEGSPTEILQLDMQASRARTRLEALRAVK